MALIVSKEGRGVTVGMLDDVCVRAQLLEGSDRRLFFPVSLGPLPTHVHEK